MNKRSKSPQFIGKAILACLVLPLLCVESRAANILPGPYQARVVKVIDGDTVKVVVKTWLDTEVTTSVRLSGIDAPELHGKCDMEKSMALRAKDRIAELLNDKEIVIKNVEGGKFSGRVLAEIVTEDGVNLAQVLIKEQLVRPYDGGKRLPWC